VKIDAFIPCNEIDDVYFDKPYYLAPDRMGTDAFVLLRDRQEGISLPARAGPASYLNDVLIGPDGAFAYFTDSGSPGGLVALDLGSGKAWRVLSDDPSTQAEKEVVVETDGKPLRRPDGREPQFNGSMSAFRNASVGRADGWLVDRSLKLKQFPFE
jgi:hypothetical protein